jgi:hypothetical protein
VIPTPQLESTKDFPRLGAMHLWVVISSCEGSWAQRTQNLAFHARLMKLALQAGNAAAITGLRTQLRRKRWRHGELTPHQVQNAGIWQRLFSSEADRRSLRAGSARLLCDRQKQPKNPLHRLVSLFSHLRKPMDTQ